MDSHATCRTVKNILARCRLTALYSEIRFFRPAITTSHLNTMIVPRLRKRTILLQILILLNVLYVYKILRLFYLRHLWHIPRRDYGPALAWPHCPKSCLRTEKDVDALKAAFGNVHPAELQEGLPEVLYRV